LPIETLSLPDEWWGDQNAPHSDGVIVDELLRPNNKIYAVLSIELMANVLGVSNKLRATGIPL
jgi:predicted hotdog family 3-hydroxylacyl-ACP dehydratase